LIGTRLANSQVNAILAAGLTPVEYTGCVFTAAGYEIANDILSQPYGMRQQLQNPLTYFGKLLLRGSWSMFNITARRTLG
jgi:hypothetical protein